MSGASLSRERIAEVRRQALDLTDAHERAEALALLDAYEAQRRLDRACPRCGGCWRCRVGCNQCDGRGVL